MAKSAVQTTRSEHIQRVWLASSTAFVLLYPLCVLKALTGIGINRRAMHILSTVALIAAYGSCVSFKIAEINIQKLLRDGNFRCLLVACSLLSMRSAVVPMLPFLITTTVALAAYVVKNRKKHENTQLLHMAIELSSIRDEATVLALKIEVLAVPFLIVHLLAGNADVFVVSSYISMVWFEHSTNPCMKKAVKEIAEKIEDVMKSPSMPIQLRKKYESIKTYTASKMHIQDNTKKQQ